MSEAPPITDWKDEEIRRLQSQLDADALRIGELERQADAYLVTCKNNAAHIADMEALLRMGLRISGARSDLRLERQIGDWHYEVITACPHLPGRLEVVKSTCCNAQIVRSNIMDGWMCLNCCHPQLEPKDTWIDHAGEHLEGCGDCDPCVAGKEEQCAVGAVWIKDDASFCMYCGQGKEPLLLAPSGKNCYHAKCAEEAHEAGFNPFV